MHYQYNAVKSRVYLEPEVFCSSLVIRSCVTTGEHSSLIVSGDRPKSYRTTGGVSPRQESVIPIPLDSHWIQITGTAECYKTANSTNVSTRRHRDAYRNFRVERHYIVYCLKLGLSLLLIYYYNNYVFYCMPVILFCDS